MKQENMNLIRFGDGQEASNEFIEHMARLHRGQNMGFSTGFNDIDQATGGLKKGDFWIISAMSSMGKTALALEITLNAMKEGAHALFFSMEMNVKSLMARAVANKGKIHLAQLTKDSRFLNPTLEYDAKTPYRNEINEANGRTLIEQIAHTIEEIKSLNPIFIDDPYLDLMEIKELCERYNSDRQSIDLIVPDYLQLIHSIDANSREREVANVSNAFKKMAVSLDCTVLSPVQLNERQQVRESRVIEQDANVHLQIRADQKAFDKEGVKNPEGIVIAKNRDGERSSEPIPLFLKGKYQSFELQT